MAFRFITPFVFLVVFLAGLAALPVGVGAQSAPESSLSESSPPESSLPLIVEADESLQWRRDERQYIATGNAMASQGAITLRAAVITADYEDDNSSAAINITRIIGTGAARLDEHTYQARADSITYDLLTGLARLEGGDVVITGADGTITAGQSITYDRPQRLVIAQGGAEVLLANGQRLKGERIEARINVAEDNFISIHATGGAEVYSPGPEGGGREARATAIDYDRNTSIAVLTGAVEITDANNRITGDRATLNILTGISTMTSSGGRISGIFTP